MEINNKIDNNNLVKIVGNGPIENIIGAIISLIITIVVFAASLFFIVCAISDYNIRKNYVLTTATIIDDLGVNTYAVKYTIDDNEYTADLVDVNKHNIGDTTEIYYKPDDYNNITYVPQKINFNYFLPVILTPLICILCFISTKRYFNNFMHYIKPQKYKLDEHINDTSIGIDNNNLKIETGIHDDNLDK